MMVDEIYRGDKSMFTYVECFRGIANTHIRQMALEVWGLVSDTMALSKRGMDSLDTNMRDKR